MTRKELLESPMYWFENVNIKFYRLLVENQIENDTVTFSKTCEEYGLDKDLLKKFLIDDEVSITLKEFIEQSVKLGYAPVIEFKKLKEIE
jgi:hypothetical protein